MEGVEDDGSLYRSTSMEEVEDGGSLCRPVYRDIRRYYCEYCGICRSKKSLITSHILSHHRDELNKGEDDKDPDVDGGVANTCTEYGACFKKPAHLKQHILSHSLERPFRCPIDDCVTSYRRKDHLNRHLLIHEGKLFRCLAENCTKQFSMVSNMKRHMKEFHEEVDADHPSVSVEGQMQYVCQEPGCGKAFKYPSKLRKHKESHVKLNSVEAFCSEPNCMKYFTDEECLKAHVKSCHQYIHCELCGAKQLKKNIKRHIRTHNEESSPKEFKCSYEGCSSAFSTSSNLQKHVKAVHEKICPFICGFLGCGMRFAYKHVRDNHEKTECHNYTCGDFEELDEQFQARPRGGQKRKHVTAEMLIRKRVMPPPLLDPEVEPGQD